MHSSNNNLPYIRKLETFEVYLQYLVIYGTPLFLVSFLFLLIISIDVVPPYIIATLFSQTTCRVEKIEQLDVVASCSAGTDLFSPCLKVYVSFATGGADKQAIIMENEQALLNCQQCSYTFGRHSWRHSDILDCGTWKENFDHQICINQYLIKYGNFNTSYPCYFNSLNHSQVVHALSLDLKTIVHGYLWPILLCVIYGTICIVLFFIHKEITLHKRSVSIQAKKRGSIEVQRELKKNELNKCLGIQSFGRKKSQHEIHESVAAFENLSASQLMKTARDPDQNEDMRHLDLAVTEQNIEALANTYAYFAAYESSTFPRKDIRSRQNSLFNWHSTLPVSLKQSKKTHNYPNRRHHSLDFWNSSFEGDSPNLAAETVSITTSNMLTEHEIDSLYKAQTLTRNPVLTQKNSTVRRKKSETTV